MEKHKKSSGNLKKVKLGLRTMRVFSRHPSHSKLRNAVKLPFLALLRLGSTNSGTLPYKVELNSPQAIKNSSNKLLMKECFTKADVKTADWWILENILTDSGEINYSCKGTINCYHAQLPYPIVAKHHFGSRGQGNSLIKSQQELETWMKGKTLSNYIFEKYYNFNKEYRLHVDSEGCFYTCRKMLKEGTPEEQKWHRHDSNSVWIMEENPAFDKPTNWNVIVDHCLKALKGVGLDVGAVDLKVQSAKDGKGNVRENPDFIVIEINSAPSFGDVTLQKYIKQIPIIAKRKYEGIH